MDHIGFRNLKIVGFGLFVCSLSFYRSYENRDVLERWSITFFLLMTICWIIFLLALIWIVRPGGTRDKPGRSRLIHLLPFDLAILFWGMAYFIEAASKHEKAGRITDLNLFGSTQTASVVLDWISLACIFIAGTMFIFPRLTAQWKNAYLPIAAMMVVALVGEGFVRLRAVIAPFPQGFPTHTTEMWANRFVKRNKNGFRDTNHSVHRAPDTERILIVGDSYAFGWGIESIDERFGEQLALQLTSATKTKWEVLNASEQDTHTLDHIKSLQRSLLFQPDIVILLYVFNDIDYLRVPTRRLSALASPGVRSILFRNSFLFQELYLLARRANWTIQPSMEEELAPYSDSGTMSQHLRDLAEFVKIASKVTPTVRVVHFDFRMVQNRDYRPVYDNFIHQSLAAGIPTWTLNDVFEKYTNAELRLNRYDGHPNALANRIAAKRVAELILAEYNRPYHTVQ
jgi:hypothetical protein